MEYKKCSVTGGKSNDGTKVKKWKVISEVIITWESFKCNHPAVYLVLMSAIMFWIAWTAATLANLVT